MLGLMAEFPTDHGVETGGKWQPREVRTSVSEGVGEQTLRRRRQRKAKYDSRQDGGRDDGVNDVTKRRMRATRVDDGKTEMKMMMLMRQG